ncbi:centrosomal protein of 290 kDa-like [Actinia tenebrosa]|uniref:Centrosomal protein of 290 kDa-like n=1 Tax=Actinia tenebrosa TaxID=6105 RepID=A0A6P8J7D5_ACTTE|nr:centrosomal protein of 290 kDa-like [Actinia tenebrosa]
MASALAKSETRPAGRTLPSSSAHGRPSKIPVRSDTSSGSASDDSDDGAKSSLKAKRYGKSKIPRAVPVKNVTCSTEHRTLEEKPQRSGLQQKLSSTSKNSSANPKVAGAKASGKEEIAKLQGGLKRKELIKESPSFNAARSNTRTSGTRRMSWGIQKKSTKTSKVTPTTGEKAKKGSGLPEEEQEKPRRGTTPKTSASKHPVFGKVNNEKVTSKNYTKKRQNTASASKKKTITPPRERVDNKTPKKLKSDVAVKKEEEEESDSSLSDNSLGSEPQSSEYEAETDELPASDSDPECVLKEDQSQTDKGNEKQEIVDSVHDNDHGLQCVPEQADGGAKYSSKEKELDGSERKVVKCEPNETETRGPSCIRGFSDNSKIHINFVYETESDEFTSSHYSESSKERCEEKEEEKKADFPAQSSDKKDQSLHDAEEELALTDCEIESIAEDSDIEQQDCSSKQNNNLSDRSTTEIANNTEENVLQNHVKTSLKAAKESGQAAKQKTSSEVIGKSLLPLSHEGDGKDTVSDKNQSEDSDDSFFGINVAKFYVRNTTGQSATYKAEDMEPKDNTFDIERKDLQGDYDGDYLANNCESNGNKSYILNAIKDEICAGLSQDPESVNENDEGKIQNKGNTKFEVIQNRRMLVGFEQIPYENDKDKKKLLSVEEDPFVTELEKLLLSAETDIDEDTRKCQASNTSNVAKKITSLIKEEYVPYKPPIAPKQHPKERVLGQSNELDSFLKFDGVGEKDSEQTKGCSTKDSSTAKPEKSVEDVCSSGDTNADLLLRKKVKQTFEGILKASNELSKQEATASTSATSKTESAQASNESSKQEATVSTSATSRRESAQAAGRRGNSLTTSGMSGSRNATAGESGDDDPNDPNKRPQLQKEPDDMKDEDTEEQRRRAAKKELINQMMGITDGLLQNEFQSLSETLFTRRQSIEAVGTLETFDETLPSRKGNLSEVSCVQADEEHNWDSCTLANMENDGAMIHVLTNENTLLKKELLKLKSEVNQKTKEVMETRDKNRTYKNVISTMEVDLELLEGEKNELTQEYKDLTNEEILKELRKLHSEISEASKELASEEVLESELRGPTSSPLSVELAEVDVFSQQPKVDETNEIVTLMHSISAMTEELRDQITKSKTKLAKAYSNSSLNELEDMDGEKLRELREEIADLQEQLVEERTKFEIFENICKNRTEENKKLRDRVADLEIDVARAEGRLKETITYKNRELVNIRNNMELNGNKVDELVRELHLLSEGNSALKSVIDSLNSRIRFRERRETELENMVDELTTENEKLLQQVSKERNNLKNYQRANDQRIAAHSMEVARIESALQDKIDELVDVLSSIDNFYAGDEPLPDHPCMGAIEKGIKILYDVSGLMKAIGCPDLPSGNEISEAVLQETKERRQLEIMIEGLRQEVKNLKSDKKRFEMKLNTGCREDTGKADERDERETQLSELEQQISTLQSDNTSLSQLLGDVKELAAKDAEVHQLQLSGHLNRIKVLQEENDEQKVQIKTLNENLLDRKENNQALKNEVEDLQLGKEALQQKVQAKVKEVLEHMAKHETVRKKIQEVTAERQTFQQKVEKQKKELSEHQLKIESLTIKLKAVNDEKEDLKQKFSGQNVDNEAIDTKLVKPVCTGEADSQPLCNCAMAGSSDKTNDSQVQNDELKEKLEVCETFLAQVKTEKMDYLKALKESRQNVKMMRKSSDEQIAKLKQELEGKDLSENELQKTMKLLEEKIATLEDEKAESIKQMKGIIEGIQGENELEERKKECKEQELELRKSISEPRSEKTDAQKELLTKVTEKFEIRMKEFDKCLKDRYALQEELACLKDLHLEQKKELEYVTQEKRKMKEEIKEKRTEVKFIRESSSEIINDLEKQLKDRQDFALEMQEKATFLSQRVAQLEAEKCESVKKIEALMQSLNAKEDIGNHLTEIKNSEELRQGDMMLVLKESNEKVLSLEKELEGRSESEAMMHNKISSLDLRMSELNAEKAQRENKMKTLLEALNAKKNLEEDVQKNDEVEKQLLQKMEEMKSELSRLKFAKEDLERQLLSQFTSPEQSQNIKDDPRFEESAKRETELKNQIKKLSDEKIKAEKMLHEGESQSLLVMKTSDAKIEDLENQLKCKSLSEVELQEKQRLLEHKILLLEGERVQHSRSISSIVSSLKAKKELCEAVKARDDAEKNYNIKLDEMETIVNKLRKEKSKHDCDVDLKQKYKDEYEESRRHVKKLTEDIYRYNERVEELQAFIYGCEEQGEEFDEVDLSENIEDLRSSLGTSDVELIQTQQTLQAKISNLEVEKGEFESVLTALLNSMEAKEKIEYCVEATREADKKVVKQMDEIIDTVQRLKAEKELVEQELHTSENIRVAIALDAEMLQTQSDEKISLLEQTLKERLESEKDLKERLELMRQELARFEGEKYQADKILQTMLASLQRREKLENCLKEQERIETELNSNSGRALNLDRQEVKSVASLIELLQSKEQQFGQCQKEKEEAEKSLKTKEMELELRVKDAERQSQIEKLKANLTVMEEEKKDLQEKLEKHGKVSEEREEEVNKIIQSEQDLLQRLSHAENILEQLKEDKHVLKKQLRQERLERQDASNSYMDKISFVSNAIEQKHADTESELRQAIDKLNSQIATMQQEKEASIEEYRKAVENLNMELVLRSKREAKLREQLDDLEDEITNTKTELKKEIKLQEEKEKEIENLKGERKILSENVTKMESKLTKELEKLSQRETELKEEKETEIKRLKSENNAVLENLKTKMLKLETELEYQVKNEAALREEKAKVLEELKLQDDIKTEVDRLKSIIKTIEEECRRLREERSDLQSEAARSAQTSRDTITRLQEDLKNQNDNNENLQTMVNEIKSKESCFLEEKRRHEQEISDCEGRIMKQKEYLEKSLRKLKKQKEHEQRMKDDLTSQVNELSLEITRLLEVKHMQEEEKAEYESNIRRLKVHIESLETQINYQKNELVESQVRISVLEDFKVQSDAEHERRQQEAVSECKRANAKIDELRKELHLDLKSTSVLENEIKTLKGKTAEINQKTESQKSEIANLYRLSKGKVNKDDEQIEKLKKGSEELRGQVLCLQEEKESLASTMDAFQLFVARHKIEMERLENKIKEQEGKMNDCQTQSFENTQGIEVLQSSLDNSERLRNTWHFYNDFKKWCSPPVTTWVWYALFINMFLSS